MNPHRLEPKKLLLVTGFLSVLLFIGLLLITELSILSAALRVGTIFAFLSFFWYYFERFGWRQKFFRMGGWLCDIPDLRGRWEGKLDRKDEHNPHDFVIEISQTLMNVQCFTYSSRGSSESFVADIITDQNRNQFKLLYTWIGRGGPLANAAETGMFYGTTILNFVEGPPKRLEGEYYTNRLPQQTRGTIRVVWNQLNLKRSFE